MRKNQTINEELAGLKKSAPVLSSLSRENCFLVPIGYWAALGGRIIKRCKTNLPESEVTELLSGIPKVNPFSVPENYFDSLRKNITEQCITGPETAGLSLQISGDKNENPFAVPDGYFDGLAERILEKTRYHTPGRVRLLYPVTMRRTAYAIAAALAGILVIIGITLFVYKIYKPLPKEQITHVTPADLIESPVMYEIDEDLIIENIDDGNTESSGDEKDAEEYLINNNVDLNTLLNEL
ncbi:MAG: hypothetical protein HYY40_04965 [Bacteroidetes bacterium]|nr:hypothetical protein [Bacteroidota bacterium]